MEEIFKILKEDPTIGFMVLLIIAIIHLERKITLSERTCRKELDNLYQQLLSKMDFNSFVERRKDQVPIDFPDRRK